jgi:hypothetical protein
MAQQVQLLDWNVKLFYDSKLLAHQPSGSFI